jgi:hypothetical protein
MITSVFASLLSCETCGHAIESHDGEGCHAPSCDCPCTRDKVIEQNIALAKTEYRYTKPEDRGAQ